MLGRGTRWSLITVTCTYAWVGLWTPDFRTPFRFLFLCSLSHKYSQFYQMDGSMSYFLPINESRLVFFPHPPMPQVASDGDVGERHFKNKSGRSCVVQVIIRQARKDVIEELTTFYLSQQEITKAVETVIYACLFAHIPELIQMHGNGYTLYGRRKGWSYGKQLNLRWGDDGVNSVSEKWSFILEVDK
ncbi:hypothetical protein BJ165DRAFT_114827 [Panaeolus papilionaceus]|nr:hypothetical protein BJ165DRAFT_114827 [Panaeolus papilionaceus]